MENLKGKYTDNSNYIDLTSSQFLYKIYI